MNFSLNTPGSVHFTKQYFRAQFTITTSTLYSAYADFPLFYKQSCPNVHKSLFVLTFHKG